MYYQMAIQRLQMIKNKKTNSVKVQKIEIAKILADGKEEKARIKVEHIIRDDFLIEAYEILELFAELIHGRIKQITNSKECPADLKEAVASLIWAANNVGKFILNIFFITYPINIFLIIEKILRSF